MRSASATYSPASMAQMPVPVPTSKMRCGSLPIGDKCSLLPSIRRHMWWTISSLFVRLAIILPYEEGVGNLPVLFFLVFEKKGC